MLVGFVRFIGVSSCQVSSAPLDVYLHLADLVSGLGFNPSIIVGNRRGYYGHHSRAQATNSDYGNKAAD